MDRSLNRSVLVFHIRNTPGRLLIRETLFISRGRDYSYSFCCRHYNDDNDDGNKDDDYDY